jgi:transposase, IS5 family
MMSLPARAYIIELEGLLPMMIQVYDVAYRMQILGEKVPVEDKLVSIYEAHTDIIVKGSRKVQFGHKVNISTGKSNLILSCDILEGNPADSSLFENCLQKIKASYDQVPTSSVADGGFASMDNLTKAQGLGVQNVVFNKVKGKMQNRAQSKNKETRLKKWRSGIEANISNLLRGFNIRRCNWEGLAHFKQKVLWSVLAYNIRVMTVHVTKPPTA